MKFICKGCGKTTEMSNRVWKIQEEYCEHCGRRLPNGRRNFLITQSILVGIFCFSKLIQNLFSGTTLWVSLLLHMGSICCVTFLLVKICFYLEGKREPLPFEGKSVRRTICPSCKEEVSLFCGRGSVKCTHCGEVFFQKESTELEKEVSIMNVAGTILTILLALLVTVGIGFVLDDFSGIYMDGLVYLVYLILFWIQYFVGTRYLCRIAERKSLSEDGGK